MALSIRLAVSALMMTSVGQAAWAQNPPTTIELDASDGTPTIDVTVKKRTVRFALDPVLGPNAAVNPEAAKRLGLNGLPVLSAQAAIGDARVRGKTARFGISMDDRREMVWAALLGRPHVTHESGDSYDLAGGFEALPADRVIVHLNHDVTAPTRQFVFEKPNNDKRTGFPVMVAGLEMRMMVQFINRSSWLDRRAAQQLVNQRAIAPVGAVRNLKVWFDLEMPVQDIVADMPITVNGLAIEPLQARTASPLIQPEHDENVIVVTGDRDDDRPPTLLLGTGALRNCTSLVFERVPARLTLNCAASE